MIIIIVGTIISLLIISFSAFKTWTRTNSYYDSIWDKIGEIVFIIVIVGIVSTIIVGILLMVTTASFYPRSYQVKSITKTDMVLMNDNVRTTGSWSILGGSVESSGKFFFYSNNHGVHRLQSIPADKVEIIEDSANPYLEDIEYRYQWRAWGVESAAEPKHVFHIPEGSINHTITLDGE